MKRIFLAATSLFCSLIVLAEEPVNEKVMQAFTQSFKHVKDVVWHEYANYYEVVFKQQDIRARISYDTDGNIVKSLRYYTEDQLPFFVRAKLQKQYAGKKVYGVTELTEWDQINYHVVLEDEKSWTHVKCDPYGSMETVKKYRKAGAISGIK